MRRHFPFRLFGTGLALALCAGGVAGQDSMPEAAPPVVSAQSSMNNAAPAVADAPNPGGASLPPGPACTTCKPCYDRAGNAQWVAWYALPSNTTAYVGYYVGGGAACLGEARHVSEGTWGWDYQGCLFLRRVGLDWWHGRRYQDGIGRYRTVSKPDLASPSTP